MIKVELFYKVSMFDTDWMMTAEEYQEFREQALNIPLAVMYPRVEPIKPIDYIATVESAEDDQAEECPDYIEPPAVSKSMGAGLEPEVICENGACTLALPEEEEVTESPPEVKEKPKKPKKAQKAAKGKQHNWQKYIDMGNEGASKDEIRDVIMVDKGCRASVAGIYYARYILPNIKLVKVETVEEKKPEPGKFFTDEERLRIQKKLGLK